MLSNQPVPTCFLYPGCSVDLIGINPDCSLCTGINVRFLSRPDAQWGSAGECCTETRRVGFNPCPLPPRLCSMLCLFRAAGAPAGAADPSPAPAGCAEGASSPRPSPEPVLLVFPRSVGSFPWLKRFLPTFREGWALALSLREQLLM